MEKIIKTLKKQRVKVFSTLTLCFLVAPLYFAHACVLIIEWR